MKDQIAILTQQLDWLKRQLFGRKSEQLDHPDLFTAQPPGKPASSGDAAAPEEQAPSTGTKSKKRPRKIREARLPEHLPVRTEEIIPEIVQANPQAWRNCGFEEKTQLEKEPAYFYLRRTLRMKFVPVENPLSPPVIEPAKPTIIEGGFWGPGLLAEILSNKYLYHLPFDRQHVLNKQRHGVNLSPNTMGDAAAKIADQCGLLVGLMKQRMLEGRYVRADETFIRYLDKLTPGGSSTGYFWVYRGLTGDVIFDWQTSREHHHASDWLGSDYEGILQSDGYQAYENYCRAQRLRGKKVKRAACLAHIRRKFEKARAEWPEVIDWILRIIARLYILETPMREYGADAAVRLRVRQNRSRPLVALLGKAFKRLINTRIRPKSGLGQALQYALGQWPAMQTFLEDGRVEIDNNDTENDIRPSAVGKKNWLFVGSPEAGKRSAVMYTLLISARNHGVDPQAYLRAVIERLPGARTVDLDALLPANWAAANRAAHPAIKSERPQAA
ncbi:MAG: IS66 family transposase [Luteolibacter sp.]